MGDTTFITLVNWIITHGYFLFTIAAFVEGPVVTIAAGVAAALGYYNIYLIILIAIFGDIGADVVYYAIGYWSRKRLIDNYGHYVGITPRLVEKTESMMHRNLGKALAVIKISPFIAVPGLIIVGSTHVKLKRFIKTSLLIGVPKVIFFALAGFYSGRAYQKLSGLLSNGEYALFGVLVLVILIYITYQKITVYFAQRTAKRL